MTIATGQTATAADVLGRFVSKKGDVMDGSLQLAADPVLPLQAATMQYVDAAAEIADAAKATADAAATTAGAAVTKANASSAAAQAALDAVETKVSLAGDNMTGPLGLPGDPVTDLQAAPRQFVLNAPITATGSTVARTLPARFADVANILDHGAVYLGLGDSTAAIQRAAATGKNVYVPAGTYLVSDTIVIGNNQCIFGDNRNVSNLRVDAASCNLSAAGIIQLGLYEAGAAIRDLQISFTQPDTAVRANTVAFPPAIIAPGGRCQITRVRIAGARIGFDGARSGTNGSNTVPQIDDFEVGALECGMILDGSRDFTSITNYHFWLFGISDFAGLTTVYHDGGNTAASFGDCDGVSIKGFNTFGAPLKFTSAASGGWFSIVNLSLDGDGAYLDVAGAGWLQIANCYSTKGTAPTLPAINVTDGRVMLTNYYQQTAQTTPSVVVSGAAAELSVFGGSVASNNTATTVFSVDAGMLRLSNLRFIPTGTPAYTAPWIAQSGTGRLTVKDCAFNAGSGVGISITSDNDSIDVGSNLMRLWTYAIPASAFLGKYGDVFVPDADRSSYQTGTYSFANFTALGNYSTGYGFAVFSALQDGAQFNTAFGAQAAKGLTTGDSNSYFGTNAGLGGTTASTNCGFGYGALQTNLIAVANAAFGYSALKFATGNHNTAMGASAGSSVTTGFNNTIIGYNVASTTLTTGVNNIIIGVDNHADTAAASDSNTVRIQGTGANPAILVTGTDTASPVVKLTGSLGLWGHSAPASKPAAPTTLADVIAILQSYGLSA